MDMGYGWTCGTSVSVVVIVMVPALEDVIVIVAWKLGTYGTMGADRGALSWRSSRE